VQVKSASARWRNVYSVAATTGAAKRPYRRAEVDVLAAYVVPEDAWYLIPVGAIWPRKTIRLSPHQRSRRKFETYREAWHLLGLN
jgi:hypothetical protein